jgi:hypothetical protein
MTAKRLAELREKRAEFEDAIRQLEVHRAAVASFERDLHRAFDWPTDKPVKQHQATKFDKRGRPTKYNRAPATWKGRRGYEFVLGIMKIQARDKKCRVAAAIRELKKNDPKKWPEPERDLQRRYLESKQWRPWCRIAMMLEADAAALLAKTESLTKAP